MSTIEQYISAFNENWAEYEQLKASLLWYYEHFQGMLRS